MPDRSGLLSLQLERADGVVRLRELTVGGGLDMAQAVLEAAETFASEVLAPLNPTGDRPGARLVDGRVVTAPGHREAWQAFADAGWPTLDQPERWGGQGLPLVLGIACQEVFDGANPAFGMLTTLLRAASRLLQAHGDAPMQEEWLPRLASGEWAATICISEPDAGSDVGRIRTMATPTDDGEWRITGEKCWISYGDHDLGGRIGHCLLARTPDAPPGGAGLSLFLVPDRFTDDHGETVRNGVEVRRLEEKLGLHGSPTCALGFEGARGRLIGKVGRGLSQLFAMITSMRMSVAAQGLGIASRSAEVALGYALERRQGGDPKAPAVSIARHADVRRMLAGSVARTEALRSLVYTAAAHVDLAEHEEGAAAASAGALVQWLLPIVKTAGAEAAFEVSSEAIQVLGGAGYVRDWPVEQALRDSRVLAIYEGTSGMQALDLVHRRLGRDGGEGLRVFLEHAARDLAQAPPSISAPAQAVLDLLSDAARQLGSRLESPDAEAGATAFLQLATLAATAWTAVRLATPAAGSPAERRLAASGRYWLSDLPARAAVLHAQVLMGAARLSEFDEMASG